MSYSVKLSYEASKMISDRMIDSICIRLEELFLKENISFTTSTISDCHTQYSLDFTVRVWKGDAFTLYNEIYNTAFQVANNHNVPTDVHLSVVPYQPEATKADEEDKKVLIAVSSRTDELVFNICNDKDLLSVSTVALIRTALENYEDEQGGLEYQYQESLFSDRKMGFYYVWVNSRGYVTNLEPAGIIKSSTLDDIFRLVKDK